MSDGKDIPSPDDLAIVQAAIKAEFYRMAAEVDHIVVEEYLACAEGSK
jgi:hypothetical protein